MVMVPPVRQSVQVDVNFVLGEACCSLQTRFAKAKMNRRKSLADSNGPSQLKSNQTTRVSSSGPEHPGM